MKHEKKRLILTTVICLLPIMAGLVLYSRLPERVPTHFDFSGTPDGWSSRPFAVFGLPCLLAALNVFLYACLNRDPKRANMSGALKTVSQWSLPVLSVLCYGLTLTAALGYPSRIEIVVPLLTGILLLVIGNYLPKTKQSYTMGIRLPWTLQSEENWNRTHRLSGFLWVAAGAAFILLSLLRLWNIWLLGALLLALIFVPIGYSYFLHKKGI
ncbi:SdpI family protein [Dysosmobacter sp.]|uniref:SdpI family protein n=1 Tax=Dysosmobacter sp. TaxID=2591382 RepID=UPI003AEFD638